MECPVCYAMIKEFQTKDGTPTMGTVDFTEVDTFYAICPSCASYIEFYYSPEKENRTLDDYKMRILDLPVGNGKR